MYYKVTIGLNLNYFVPVELCVHLWMYIIPGVGWGWGWGWGVWWPMEVFWWVPHPNQSIISFKLCII